MTNHPNRAKPVQPGTRTAEEIKAARLAAGLTQEQAGALIWYSEIAWKQWEGGDRRMHPCAWWAFQQRASVLAARPKGKSWREQGVLLEDILTTKCPACGALDGYCDDSDKHNPTHAGFHAARVSAAGKAKAGA